MPKFKAPEHVSSVSIAGTEYKVENGFVEAPIEVHAQISPLGFTLSPESQNDSDTDDKAERDAKKKAEAEAKKQAAAEAKARIKAEEEAKKQAAAEGADTSPPADQE